MQLTKRQRNQCKAIFTLLVVALLLDTMDKETGGEGSNAATKQCAKAIDDMFTEHDEQAQNAMKFKIQKARANFSKAVHHLGMAEGVVGSLRFLTGGKFKTTPGTRLNYIVSLFAENLKNIEEAIDFEEKEAKLFESRFRQAASKI